MRAKTASVFLVLTLFASDTLFAPKFKSAPARVTVKTLEGPAETITLDASSIETGHDAAWSMKSEGSGAPTAEFIDASGKWLAIELMFDTYETGEDVSTKIPAALGKLIEPDKSLKRPPMSLFSWGSNLPTFKGVVESMNVKYTLFLEDGTPCRATVNLKMKEASRAQTKSEQPSPCD